MAVLYTDTWQSSFRVTTDCTMAEDSKFSESTIGISSAADDEQENRISWNIVTSSFQENSIKLAIELKLKNKHGLSLGVTLVRPEGFFTIQVFMPLLFTEQDKQM